MLKTKEQFIKDAEKIHGDKYNYDEIEYKGNKIKVRIWCNKCEEYFEQKPNDHLSGCGCPYCHRITNKNFIKKATKIHNNKYEYNNINIKNNKTKIQIYCKKCKQYFSQRVSAHLCGQGCPFCGRFLSENKKEKRRIDFIEKSKQIHGNKYNYDKVVYKNATTKVEIYCNNCKKYFWQDPSDHAFGNGCPLCSKSKGEIIIAKFFKQNNIKYESQYIFNDCKDKKPLPFDFYLPDHNLCIEYQGGQHYSPNMFISLYKSKEYGMKKFETQKRHDQIKKEYCEKHNISFLEICYNENIKEKLEKHIKLV